MPSQVALNQVTVTVNGAPVVVPSSCDGRGCHDDCRDKLAARQSAANRAVPLCGMGICFECRVTIDGK